MASDYTDSGSTGFSESCICQGNSSPRTYSTVPPLSYIAWPMHHTHIPWIDNVLMVRDFPGGSLGKESTCSVGDWTLVQSLGWEDPLEEGTATHSSILPGESPQSCLEGYSPWGHKESDTTKRLNTAQHKRPTLYQASLGNLALGINSKGNLLSGWRWLNRGTTDSDSDTLWSCILGHPYRTEDKWEEL